MKKALAFVLAAMMIVSLAACKPATPSTAAPAPNTTAAPDTTKAPETTKATEAPTQPSGPVTITFWDENAGDQRTEYYMDLIEMFEKKNPDIHIEYLGLVQAEALQKFLAATETGTTPDTAGINESMAATIIQTGHLVPLDSYAEAWDEYQYLTPSVLDYFRNLAPNGELLMMPRTENINILWYNKTYFEEHNVTDPNTWAWEDFFGSLDELNHPEDGMYAYILRGGAGGALQFYGYLYDYLGTADQLGPDGYSNINQEHSAEFVDRYFDTYQKYTATSDITNSYMEMTGAFDGGAGSMFIHNLGSWPNHIQAFPEMGMEFGATHIPYSDFTGKVVDWSGAKSQVMFDTCPEENREAAFKWLAYLSSHEGNSYFSEKIGELPTNALVLEDPWMNEQFHIKMALELTSSDNYESKESLDYLPGWGNLMSQMEANVQAVMYKQMTGQEFVDIWKQGLDELIDEAK